jgi:hypothetical protein
VFDWIVSFVLLLLISDWYSAIYFWAMETYFWCRRACTCYKGGYCWMWKYRVAGRFIGCICIIVGKIACVLNLIHYLHMHNCWKNSLCIKSMSLIFDSWIVSHRAHPQNCYSGITDSGITALVKTTNPCTKK